MMRGTAYGPSAPILAEATRTYCSELPIIVLTGPTGAGKSDWAIRLAETAPVEIVSVDSALVYRGLDIGSAKPSRALRERIPHHLIDICEPTESYSAGRFVTDAIAHIAAIHSRRRVPLLVGGTMLYIRALVHGLAPLPQASPEVRAQLDERAEREGWPALHAELSRLDPQAAVRIAPNDSQRIQRALEVCYTSGQPISELQRATVSPLRGTPLKYCVLAPKYRSVLHDRLSERFQAMMATGFLDEVRRLRQRGDLNARHPSVRSVGYRQLWAHLDGEYGLEEAVQRGIFATRQLAKRQLTWLRAEKTARWLDPECDETSWNRDVVHGLRELGL
ncbi:MAG TPA: tRNA (adenosine(37)-N6)-dimethylallyltransferase MiaA [Steroidobacteraceae bacterium]|nr:tRNA (adenosine(37)-N6)-dimethylallyltransferase MiaA [Steroidobacteraceae bacterium]